MRGSGPPLVGVGCLLLCLALAHPAAAVTSPSAIMPEEAEYQAQQAAAAPVGQPDFQAAALAAFAAGLDADPFGVLPLWTGDSHPCGDASNNYKPWPGVTCDAPMGWVTALHLPGKALKGRLPTALGLLKTLRTLDLSNNSFYGSLPHSWSNLTSLESLDLSHNQISGQLPDTWGSCLALQSLELHHNQLSGALPASWAALTLLEVFDVSNNQLSGSLPASWGQLSLLSILDLHSNSLTGSLPPAWREQRSLLQLNVGDNEIQGQLPEEWAGGMNSLRGVNVRGNSLSGSLPEKWSQMKSLQTLSVGSNSLTGSIPSTWTKLQNLYVINVTRNPGLCGDLPGGVSQAVVDGAATTQLNNVCAWEGDAQPLLDFKSGLQDASSALESWRAGSNPCGAVPWRGVLCEAGSVVRLDLSGLGLRGPLTEGLVKLSELRQLLLENNQLSGTLPAWLGAPGNLTTVDLSHNRLTGALPASWSGMARLAYLDLSFNSLQGSLPVEWSALAHLATLLLSSNPSLSGGLPGEWSALAALQKVNMDSCNISGTLPASWSRLPAVREIGLRQNLLVGSVPPSLARLPSLSLLDLSGNQQMCGGSPQDLAGAATVQRSLTGLGAQCRGGGLSATTGVIIGVCASFAGAALLAAAAYLISRQRARALQARPPALPRPVAAANHSVSGARTPSHGTASPLPASTNPSSLQPGSPRPGSTALLAGPAAAASDDSLLLWSPPATGNPGGWQHRLAHMAGPPAGSSVTGPGPLAEGVMPAAALPFRGCSPGPGGPSAAPQSPRPGTAVAAAAAVASPARLLEGVLHGGGSATAARSSPIMAAPALAAPFDPLHSSPPGLRRPPAVTAGGDAGLPAAAAAAAAGGELAGGGRPLLRDGLSPLPSPGGRPATDASASSVPPSPRGGAGCWGSAVKAPQHSNDSNSPGQAGGSPRGGGGSGSPLPSPGPAHGAAGLRARLVQLRLAEAAAAAAAATAAAAVAAAAADGSSGPAPHAGQLLVGWGHEDDGGGVSRAGSPAPPCQPTDDLGAASPRGTAALQLAAGGGPGAAAAAPESPASQLSSD